MSQSAAASQNAGTGPNETTPVTEGSTTILFPSANDVFYNPVQQFNRDLSVLAIRAWSNRYAKEKQDRAHVQDEKRKKRRKLNGNGVPIVRDDQLENTISVESEESKVDAMQGEPDVIAEARDRKIKANAAEVPAAEANVADAVEVDVSFTILEALSATGLRAIRYAKEIPNLRTVIANDLSATAVKQIQSNSEYNKTTSLVQPNEGDARVVMYTTKKRFNVIDLDPYGSAAPFLDAAVQAVEDGGLLLVTCTDLAVLAGDAHPEKCWSQYGGATLRQSDFCHEQSLRMVLNTIGVSAARYGRAIKPLLSLSIDFYIRLFVRVDTSPARVKQLMSNTILTYQCVGCKSYENQAMGQMKPGSRPDLFKYSGATLGTQKNCQHCGFTQQIGGPMYGGPLHDRDFIEEILSLAREAEENADNVYGTIPRIKGMLSVAQEELEVPHHWSLPRLAKVLHCQSPPEKSLVSAILNAGYRVSGSHTGPRSCKTDAPASFIWDMMRAWILDHPIREESIREGTAGAAILARRDPLAKVDFTYNAASKAASKEQKLVRYQVNPTDNWGPKAMAKGTTSNTSDQFRNKEKRKRGA